MEKKFPSTVSESDLLSSLRRAQHQQYLTGEYHHGFVIGWVTMITVMIYTVQYFAFDLRVQTAYTITEQFWYHGTWLWLLTTPMAMVGFIGLMSYRTPRRANTLPGDRVVCWRIVTRGTNLDALEQSVQRILIEMAGLPLFDFSVEVVTDMSILIPSLHNPRVTQLVVPYDYETPHKTKWKARALHYASQHSPVKPTTWVMHLDEESCPTKSLIIGMVRFMATESVAHHPRVGQGAILYHRNWNKHRFLTLADCARTAMDFAHYRFQMLLGLPIFGIHGSYVFARNDVLKAVGFDVGTRCSRTEDAAWCLLLSHHGYRFGWVDGFLEEQSNHSTHDFLKQRARWTIGILEVIRYTAVPWYWRVALAYLMGSWLMTPFVLLFSVAYLFFGYGLSLTILYVADLVWAYYITLYIVGVRINLLHRGISSWHQQLRWQMTALVLYPAFLGMEVRSLWTAFKERGQQGFFIVQK